MVLRYLPSVLSRLPGFELLAAGESIGDDGGLMLVGMLSPVLDVQLYFLGKLKEFTNLKEYHKRG